MNMKTYKVYDIRDPRKYVFVRAKSATKAKNKGYRWLSKVPAEYIRAVRI